MATYVLIHGAWHDGDLLGPVADHIRAGGHEVHTPTLAGNGPKDDKSTGLEEAIASVTGYLEAHDLRDIVLAGHSYGGMVITGVADRMTDRITRLVYWNAFVPNSGDSLLDLVPPHFAAMFRDLAEASGDNSLTLPYPVWRDGFFNDGDGDAALAAYDKLNPQPFATFTDQIALTTDPAAMPLGKSYINGLHDAALPHSHGWHPRLSERLGLFRLVQMMGGHESCLIDPGATADALIVAGRK